MYFSAPSEDGMFTWNNSADMQIMNHVNSRNVVNHVDSWGEEDGSLSAITMNSTIDISHYFQDSVFRTQIIHVRSALFKEVRKPGRSM